MSTVVQLKMVVAILTGHAPVRGHLFKGDPTCRFCRKETETVQHIICCCEALARQWEPICQTKRYEHSLSKGTLPLYKRHRAIEFVLNGVFRVVQ
jgi:hypothetical protein